MTPSTRFILASRSPRRKDLLELIVPADRVVVIPPRDATEAGFGRLETFAAIETRLAEIARKKLSDVLEQLDHSAGNAKASLLEQVVIAADTTLVVRTDDGVLHVVGQPPDDESWENTVRMWFRELFQGRTHTALTALLVAIPGVKTVEWLARTEVGFIADVEPHLNWYIETGEPRGKAGGYAIQGAGSIFISQVTGSLSNVIGLPLEALLDCFRELGVDR